MIQVLLAISVLSASGGRAEVGAAQTADPRAAQVSARAAELEAKGDHSGALALLWEAAELAPHDADVHNRLGEALELIGALDAAAAAYRRAVTDRPDFRKASNNLILVLVKSGKGAEAVARARTLLAAAPEDADRWFSLGLAQAEQDVAEGIASFRRAVELAPSHTLARYNLALVLNRSDRQPEALEELGRILASGPRSEAYYTMGVIYWHQGQLDRAERALRDAVAAEPRSADAHYALGAILKARGDWQGAADSLGRAIALRPDLWSARYTLAQVLLAAGQGSDGRAQLEEAEHLRRRAELQQEAGTQTAVGTEKLERGDLIGALDQFRRAIGIFEPYAPAHYQMGRALRRLGEEEASRAAFSRARQLNPSLVPPA